MMTGGVDAHDRTFAAALAALSRGPDARASIAILRRSAGAPRSRFDALRVLDRVVPRGASERELEAYELVAPLHAIYHQGRVPGGVAHGDLGASFARLAGSPGWTADRAARRLGLLLSADADGLPERLRQAVTLLRSAQVPIDWARLATDVRYWTHPNQIVQRRWARAFVAGRDDAHGDAAQAVDSPGTSEGDPA